MSSPVTRFNYTSFDLMLFKELQIKQITACFAQADETLCIAEKKVCYEQAFKTICKFVEENESTENLEIKKQISSLFYAYAAKTCYAQSGAQDENGVVDNEEGFRKSARLMELSLCMQLDALQLMDFSFDYTQFSTLADLVSTLEIQKDQPGKFFPLISQLNIDADALLQKADGNEMREILAQTLIHMSYAHQNIGALRNSKNTLLHTSFQAITEKMIGRETEAQKRELCGYIYNRCSFLVDLTHPGDVAKKIQSYNPVLNLLKEAYPEDHPDYISRLAQINNITGLIMLRGMPNDLGAAVQYFNKAFDLRTILLNQFKDENKKFEQEYLMSNLRTALIHCLVNTLPLDKEQILLHKEALECFIQKLEEQKNTHAYISSYRGAIDKATLALV